MHAYPLTIRSAALAVAVAGTVALALGADAARAASPGKNGRIAFTVERWRLPEPCPQGVPHGCDPEPYSSAIETVQPSGSDRRVLHEFGAEQSPSEPAWSPNGKLLAFQQLGRLAIIRHDGTRLRRLLPQLTHRDEQPAWSPDGHRLAFTGQRCLSCAGWLYTVRADGTSLRRVASTAAFGPAWSATGRIAFVNDNDRPDTVVGIEDGLYTIRPDGSGLRRLFRGRWAPDWSPDGNRLAFGTGNGVFTIGADGRGLRRVMKQRTGFHPTAPVWSPDGRFLAFVVNGDDIYVVRPNGRGLRRVVDAGEDLDHPERPWDELKTLTWQPLDGAAGRAAQDPTWTVIRPNVTWDNHWRVEPGPRALWSVLDDPLYIEETPLLTGDRAIAIHPKQRFAVGFSDTAGDTERFAGGQAWIYIGIRKRTRIDVALRTRREGHVTIVSSERGLTPPITLAPEDPPVGKHGFRGWLPLTVPRLTREEADRLSLAVRISPASPQRSLSRVYAAFAELYPDGVSR